MQVLELNKQVESTSVLSIREQNALIESHLQLAKSRASAFRASSNMPYEDLLGEAYLSLTKAARRYDPNRAVTFGAYAKSVINGYLFNYLRDRARSIRVPRKYTAVYLRIKRAEKHGKEPMTHRQLAEKLSLPLSLIEETVEAMKSNCYLMNEQTVSEELQSEAQSEHTGQEYHTMLMALKDMQDGEVDLLIDAFVNSKSPKVLARMYKMREENLETILSSLLHRIIS